jgi:aminopeptidase N
MAENIFEGISYSKGASVMRQLFNHVGESAFSLIMMRYFTRLYNSNATLADLIYYFEDLTDEDFQ